MTESIVPILKEALAGFPEIEPAILYGSFAQGRERPDSDLDLAVAPDSRLTIDRDTLIDMSLLDFAEDMLPNIRHIGNAATERLVKAPPKGTT